MFLTQTDHITCIHEPFCDAYHFGPERLSERFEDEQARIESGYIESTYKTVLDNIQKAHVAVSYAQPRGSPIANSPLGLCGSTHRAENGRRGNAHLSRTWRRV